MKLRGSPGCYQSTSCASGYVVGSAHVQSGNITQWLVAFPEAH